MLFSFHNLKQKLINCLTKFTVSLVIISSSWIPCKSIIILDNKFYISHYLLNQFLSSLKKICLAFSDKYLETVFSFTLTFQKPKVVPLWPFTEKVCQCLSRILDWWFCCFFSFHQSMGKPGWKAHDPWVCLNWSVREHRCKGRSNRDADCFPPKNGEQGLRLCCIHHYS